MAKVQWADAIKSVSGALTRINKKSQHAGDQKMILGTHRVAATTNPNCTRLYLRGLDSVTRSTAPNADELKQRARFSAVATAVAARAKDLSQMTADQAAFKAQKNEPGGKKTMKSYLWSLELTKYDQSHAG